MSSTKYQPGGRLSRVINSLEETVIAVLLGLMTLLTFTNVVLRYVFNSSMIWSLEVVLILFAWLVLFGLTYAFKVTAHLGVDAITGMFQSRGRRIFGLISAAVCIAYALLVMKGAWDYWAPFADLPKFTGRVIPTGFDTEARRFAYTITGDVPIPFEWLRTWLSTTFNSYEEGGETVVETYRKMPVLVPYAILPFAATLMLLRICQATARIWRGEAESLIVSHEAENAVEEAGRAAAAADAQEQTRTATAVGNRSLPPGAADADSRPNPTGSGTTGPNLNKEG